MPGGMGLSSALLTTVAHCCKSYESVAADDDLAAAWSFVSTC